MKEIKIIVEEGIIGSTPKATFSITPGMHSVEVANLLSIFMLNVTNKMMQDYKMQRDGMVSGEEINKIIEGDKK